jgi:hypothetical protein
MEVADSHTLQQMDETIEKLTGENNELDSEIRALSATVNNLNKQLSDDELEKEIERFSSENAVMKKKLEAIRSNGVVVNKEQRVALEKKYESLKAEWKKRKRLVCSRCALCSLCALCAVC